MAEVAEFTARLTASDYGGVPEPAIIFEISAWDVNCPQHITPRYTETEFGDITAPLRRRIAALELRLQTSQEEPP